MRVIVHLDLDCFYAQVEAVRLGIDCRVTPFVVSQWGNLIAVNYPARAAGIIRFDSVTAAREKCPEVQYCHTATFAIGESEYRYHENPSKHSHKVSLEPYRLASIKIFNILASFPQVEVEKGGVDEAFLDVTAAVQKPAEELELACREEVLAKRREEGQGEETLDEQALAAAVRDLLLRRISEHSSILWPNESALAPYLQQADEYDLKAFIPDEGVHEVASLAAASALVHTIRGKVRQELGYDCSGGIAQNKMLAKLISAANKPNKQTVLLPSATISFMATTKFEKIRGFGGKLGRQLGAVSDGAVFCGELWKHDKAWFTENMGAEEGDYIYRRLRGVCDSPVAPRAVSKSLIAQKVFQPPSRDVSVLTKWLTVLAGELRARWEAFTALHGVTARNLNIRFGPATNTLAADYGNVSGAVGDFNKTFPFPIPTTAERIVGIGSRYCAQLLQQHPDMKLISVTVSITDFKRLRDMDGLAGRPRQQQRTLSQSMRHRPSAATATAAKYDDEENGAVDCDEVDVDADSDSDVVEVFAGTVQEDHHEGASSDHEGERQTDAVKAPQATDLKAEGTTVVKPFLDVGSTRKVPSSSARGRDIDAVIVVDSGDDDDSSDSDVCVL